MARKDADKGAKARKAEKMRAALEYKKAGATERFIAERLAISPATAHRYIAEALDNLREQTMQGAQEMVALESERIDQARFAIAAKVVRGELDAIDRWFKASSEYRKLHGLDAPEKRALTDPSGTQAWQPLNQERVKAFRKLPPDLRRKYEEVLTFMESLENDSGSEDDEDD
jgi:hypothetical protein